MDNIAVLTLSREEFEAYLPSDTDINDADMIRIKDMILKALIELGLWDVVEQVIQEHFGVEGYEPELYDDCLEPFDNPLDWLFDSI